MRGILRIFHKDLFEFIRSPGIILLTLILPLILLLLIGGIKIRDSKVNLLVLQKPDLHKENPEEELEALSSILEEFSDLTFSIRNDSGIDTLMIIEKEHYDLVFKIDERIFYTAETDKVRLDHLSSMANQISNVIEYEKPMIFLNPPFSESDISFDLMSYFPSSTLRDLFAIPKVIALIVCFLPFLLAAGSFIRERDEETIGLLLLSLGTRWDKLYLGKMLLPLFIGIFNLAIMILFSKTWFGLNVKSGLVDIFIIHVLAVLSSVFLGFIVSCTARSQLQVYLGSALYLLCLFLFTGFIFPVELSSSVIRFFSNFFPLTFSLEPMNNWLFKGTNLSYYADEIRLLLSQDVFYLLISIFIFRKAARSI